MMLILKYLKGGVRLPFIIFLERATKNRGRFRLRDFKFKGGPNILHFYLRGEPPANWQYRFSKFLLELSLLKNRISRLEKPPLTRGLPAHSSPAATRPQTLLTAAAFPGNRPLSCLAPGIADYTHGNKQHCRKHRPGP